MFLEACNGNTFKKSWGSPRICDMADLLVNAGLRIAGECICEAVASEKMRADSQGSQVTGIHFFPYQIEGGKIWHVTNASIQEIFFLLGYQRGKFIGCWTLGTRKLAKKIQKGGWK